MPRPKQATLFDLGPVQAPSKRARLHALMRQYDIRTYRTPHMRRKDEPWLALIPYHNDAHKDIATICAESAGFYEETKMLATGEGELSAVRALCGQVGITCDL